MDASALPGARLYLNVVNGSVGRQPSPPSAAACSTAANQPGLKLNKAEKVGPGELKQLEGRLLDAGLMPDGD